MLSAIPIGLNGVIEVTAVGCKCRCILHPWVQLPPPASLRIQVTPPTVDPGTIKPFKSSFMNDWSESHNIVAKVTYDMSDDFWVTVQSLNPLVNPSSISHLNRSGLTGNARIEAFVNTTNNIVTNYVAGQVLKAAAPLLGGLAGGMGKSLKITRRAIDHIVERHFSSSSVYGTNKFVEGVTRENLEEMIKTAVKNSVGKETTVVGKTGEESMRIVHEYRFANQIGQKVSGAAYNLRVVVLKETGELITAFPF